MGDGGVELKKPETGKDRSSERANKSKKASKKASYRARHRLLSIYRDALRLKAIRSKDVDINDLSHASWKDKDDPVANSKLPLLLDLPCIANQRCGSWYAPPFVTTTTQEAEIRSCYFKSTDGHTGTWNFSLKRLNLPLLEVLRDYNGAWLIDSSVRKVIPDSLARTVPIWACVLNRLAVRLGDEAGTPLSGFDTRLYTPDQVVSTEEHLQISNLIDERVDLLYQSQAIVNRQKFMDLMEKPIRPMFVYSPSGSESMTICPCSGDLQALLQKYRILVCCNPSTYGLEKHKSHKAHRAKTISCNIPNRDGAPVPCSFFYTPGAADDEESWARNLSPQVLWEHHSEILAELAQLDDDRVDQFLDSLVAQYSTEGSESTQDHQTWDQIGKLPLSIGTRRAGRPHTCWDHFDAILNVTDQEYPDLSTLRTTQQGNHRSSNRYYLQLAVAEGKRDRTELERWMPVGIAFILHHLRNRHRILVHCNQGKDRSVAVVLACVVLTCPLVFPLQLAGDFFDHWDLASLPLPSSSARESLDEETEEYLSSGLPKSLISTLLQNDGRECFLKWAHVQIRNLQIGENEEDLEPLANKETLRIGLHLICQDREVAEPTRSTMQKLNRFFMSSSIYR